MMADLEEGLAQRLERRAERRGSSVAFRFRGRSSTHSRDLTWQQLLDESHALALRLRHDGLQARELGILAPDPRDFVIAFTAVILAGAIAVPLPSVLSRRSLPRIRAIAQAADLAAILAPRATLSDEWLEDVGWPAHVRQIPLEDSRSAMTPDRVTFDADLSRPLVLQFTSGSTGVPQGVLLSHANIVHNCAAIAHAYGLGEESVGVSWLPLHHDMGLIGHVVAPLWLGGRSVLLDPLRFLQKPLSWLGAITEERATITSAPNFAYDLCSRTIIDQELDLASVETAVCGGEPVMPETMERFIRRFSAYGFRRSAFTPSYGLAEATLLVTSGKNPDGPSLIRMGKVKPDESLRKLTSVGYPVLGTEVRIVDPASGDVVTSCEIGEIEVAGPSVGRLAGAPPSRWLKTGDLGFLSEGRLCVVGRRKEMLILRGQNVFPVEIEAAALAASSAIPPGGVAAVGIERDGTQAMVVVVEVPRLETEESSYDEFRRAVREGIASVCGHVPEEVVLVKAGSLPRTTSGKLKRLEIARRYQTGQLVCQASLPAGPRSQIEHV